MKSGHHISKKILPDDDLFDKLLRQGDVKSRNKPLCFAEINDFILNEGIEKKNKICYLSIEDHDSKLLGFKKYGMKL